MEKNKGDFWLGMVTGALASVVMCLVLLLNVGCVNASSGSLSLSGGNRILLKVTNWNVETFFDASNDGSEYREFVESKTWGEDAYVERIKRLCSVIKALDSDVFVMEEIENEEVLYDISNFLAGEWSSRKVYSYSCFAKDDGSSIGCGVLSRFPLVEMKVHGLDVRTCDVAQPSMRPIIEVKVEKGGKEICLLVNHWKSMSGGMEATEYWRNRQEGLLSGIVADCVERNEAVIACGDFNRDIQNFCPGKNGGVLLRSYSGGVLRSDGVEVKSPWFYSDGSLVEPGSYFFGNGWNRIDNFFAAGSADIISFQPETQGPWCAEDSCVPLGYKLWSGEGYSDHLPVTCVVGW